MIAHKMPIISKLLGLPESDIYQLAQDSGKIFYNITDDAFNISIDNIELTIEPEEKELKKISRTIIESSDFNLGIKDNLIIIDSKKALPSGILCSESLKQMLTNFIDISDSISVMVTENKESPIFVGNHKVLFRMGEDFNTTHKIYPISRFLGEQNV